MNFSEMEEDNREDNSNLIPIRAACLRSATAGGLLRALGSDPNVVNLSPEC